MTALQAGPARSADAAHRNPPQVHQVRRRSTPHVVVGALLVLVCALAFAVTALRVDPRTGVLALALLVSA
jgi:hypothetical protein